MEFSMCVCEHRQTCRMKNNRFIQFNNKNYLQVFVFTADKWNMNITQRPLTFLWPVVSLVAIYVLSASPSAQLIPGSSRWAGANRLPAALQFWKCAAIICGRKWHDYEPRIIVYIECAQSDWSEQMSDEDKSINSTRITGCQIEWHTPFRKIDNLSTIINFGVCVRCVLTFDVNWLCAEEGAGADKKIECNANNTIDNVSKAHCTCIARLAQLIKWTHIPVSKRAFCGFRSL